MLNFKRILIVNLLIITTTLFSVDYGLSIDESITVNSGLSNSIKATAWSNIGLGDTKFEFKGSISHSTASQPDFPYFMDVDLLKFSTLFPKSTPKMPDTRISLGRWTMSDQTGYVVAHKLDGLFMNLKYNTLSLYNYLAYSGLLWKSGSGISPSDLDSFYAGLDSQTLGSPRFITITGLTLPPIFKQRLGLEVIYQVDLRDEEYVISEYQALPSEGDQALEGGGLLNTFYASMKLSGDIPVIEDLNYKVNYIFNSGSKLGQIQEGDTYYQNSTIFAHLVDLRLEKFLPSIYNSIVSYRFVYSSGDGDSSGNDTTFLPITRSGFGAVFSPSLGNIIVNDISYSLKPLDKLQTIVKVLAFTRSTTGSISEDGLDPNSSSLYLGSELDVTANYRPFSDLGLSLTAGLYFPSSATYSAAYLEESPILGSIKLNVSFSM